MLEQTHPSTFAELLQISGLSHGTDVWLGNAEELIRRGDANLAEVIGCRDDIMVYLIHAGLDDGMAFKIMETVRKDNGTRSRMICEIRIYKRCGKIMSLNGILILVLRSSICSPKAHAAAYVLMALRVAYFKVYFPILYYCAYFSVRADDFDLIAMSKGKRSGKRADARNQ